MTTRDNIILAAVLLLYSAIISLLSYYSGKHSIVCEPEIIEIETMCYSLDPGTDGIIRTRMDEDSLYYVTFVQQQDTFAMDAMTPTEFDSLVNILYPVKP